MCRQFYWMDLVCVYARLIGICEEQYDASDNEEYDQSQNGGTVRIGQLSNKAKYHYQACYITHATKQSNCHHHSASTNAIFNPSRPINAIF